MARSFDSCTHDSQGKTSGSFYRETFSYLQTTTRKPASDEGRKILSARSSRTWVFDAMPQWSCPVGNARTVVLLWNDDLLAKAAALRENLANRK
jgi:hypothetical protein